MVQLITCEDATQASSVKDLLDGNSIDYEVSSDGMTFSVNAKNQADANILLGSNSIPTNGFTIDDALSGSISTTKLIRVNGIRFFWKINLQKNWKIWI